MNKGKEKCEFLRELRKSFAEQNGLDYSPAECNHEGDCPGTCPVCDKEMQDLLRQMDENGAGDNCRTSLFEIGTMNGFLIPEDFTEIKECGIPAPPPMDDSDDDDLPF